MIFLVLSGKMIILFPEDRQKRKDDLSQKNTWKYVFFKYDGFYKKIAQDYEYFCNIWKDGISFFFRRKIKLPLCQKKAKTNTLKGDICGITEKDDIHPREYGISFEIPR